jgi:carboxypeptidase Taq
MKSNGSSALFKKLCEHCKIGGLLESTTRLLEWDQEVNLPSEGLNLRSEQNKLLHEAYHKHMTCKTYEKRLSQLINLQSGKLLVTNLSKREAAALREMRKDYLEKSRIPASFVKKSAEIITESSDAWKKARKNHSFKEFLPHLKKVIGLCQKKAAYLGFTKHPYDALLDQYEPGMTVDKVDTIFAPLKKELIHILGEISRKGKGNYPIELKGYYPILGQKELSNSVVEKLGLGKKYYHLAETAHPFCSSLSPRDIRITTKYHEDDFTKSFYASIHECGHALYEHHLPYEEFGNPLGQPASFGIHESQSRFYETFIGQSFPFLKHFYPEIKKYFEPQFDFLSLNDFYSAINSVKPSLIRIFADEVTYNLHIILRYELEKGLIDGSIEPKNIPELWNAKMREYLGIVPKDDSEGCLQDVHWSMAFFGYFPSYALGNLYAGALYESVIKTYPDFEHRLTSGNFSFLVDFMKSKIHQFGRQYSPLELIENATGKPFSSEPYTTYLRTKYL